eukprot:scaffold22730_cov49-Phaeocystis_antarctica.AAC.1
MDLDDRLPHHEARQLVEGQHQQAASHAQHPPQVGEGFRHGHDADADDVSDDELGRGEPRRMARWRVVLHRPQLGVALLVQHGPRGRGAVAERPQKAARKRLVNVPRLPPVGLLPG